METLCPTARQEQRIKEVDPIFCEEEWARDDMEKSQIDKFMGNYSGVCSEL